jgi:hypothetical protein
VEESDGCTDGDGRAGGLRARSAARSVRADMIIDELRLFGSNEVEISI